MSLSPPLRVAFIGSKRLGLRVLEELYASSPESLFGIVTLDDSNDSRTVLSELRAFALKSSVPLHCAMNRRHSEEILRELRPDLCIVVGWYWLISDGLLKSVPKGFIGLHNSLLPEFRGGSPLIWPVLLGHTETGCSLFSFAAGMDDGPIWAQATIEIGQDEYIAEILERIEGKGLEMFRTTYPQILGGTLRPQEQDHLRATYCAPRSPKDGRIDWRRPAQEIYNLIRAVSSPYPGAFTFLEGSELKIWRARVFESTYCGSPGQVVRISDEGVYVIAGDHRALILEEAEGLHRDAVLAKTRGEPCDKTIVKGPARQCFVSTLQRVSASPGESLWYATVA